jgi:hypothetical protein
MPQYWKKCEVIWESILGVKEVNGNGRQKLRMMYL